MNLRVGDGVQQLSLLLAAENELAQLLPVDLPILEQDLWPEVVDDAGVRRSVGLHHCYRWKALIFGFFLLNSLKCIMWGIRLISC